MQTLPLGSHLTQEIRHIKPAPSLQRGTRDAANRAGTNPEGGPRSETQANHLSRQSRGSGRAADSNAPGCAGTTDPDTTDAGTTNLDTTDSDTTDNAPGNDSRNDRNTAADGTARGSVRADQSGRRADRIERNHCNT